MKALEVTGTVDRQGYLLLDQPIDVNIYNQESQRVRVIVLFPEAIISPQELEEDPDDTPIEEIKASLKRAFLQAKAGQRIPIAQMWDGIDAE
jgi:hypothetical protein